MTQHQNHQIGRLTEQMGLSMSQLVELLKDKKSTPEAMDVTSSSNDNQGPPPPGSGAVPIIIHNQVPVPIPVQFAPIQSTAPIQQNPKIDKEDKDDKEDKSRSRSKDKKAQPSQQRPQASRQPSVASTISVASNQAKFEQPQPISIATPRNPSRQASIASTLSVASDQGKFERSRSRVIDEVRKELIRSLSGPDSDRGIILPIQEETRPRGRSPVRSDNAIAKKAKQLLDKQLEKHEHNQE